MHAWAGFQAHKLRCPPPAEPHFDCILPAPLALFLHKQQHGMRSEQALQLALAIVCPLTHLAIAHASITVHQPSFAPSPTLQSHMQHHRLPPQRPCNRTRSITPSPTLLSHTQHHRASQQAGAGQEVLHQHHPWLPALPHCVPASLDRQEQPRCAITLMLSAFSTAFYLSGGMTPGEPDARWTRVSQPVTPLGLYPLAVTPVGLSPLAVPPVCV